MIVTAKFAKTQRCCGPMPCGKHDHKNPPERLCIGSNCMAWRIAPAQDWTNNRPTGWCGRASKPQ